MSHAEAQWTANTENSLLEMHESLPCSRLYCTYSNSTKVVLKCILDSYETGMG